MTIDFIALCYLKDLRGTFVSARDFLVTFEQRNLFTIYEVNSLVRLSNFSHAMLKSWEEPGDEARSDPHFVTIHIIMFAQICI